MKLALCLRSRLVSQMAIHVTKLSDWLHRRPMNVLRRSRCFTRPLSLNSKPNVPERPGRSGRSIGRGQQHTSLSSLAVTLIKNTRACSTASSWPSIIEKRRNKRREGVCDL